MTRDKARDGVKNETKDEIRDEVKDKVYKILSNTRQNTYTCLLLFQCMTVY